MFSVFSINDKGRRTTLSKIYLGIEGSYKSFQISLFENRSFLNLIEGDRVQASSEFIFLLDKILKESRKTFEDLDFIAVNQGPGAFTSLRVIISTLNGIAFSKKVSLIGIDGLDALAEETLDSVTNICPPVYAKATLGARDERLCKNNNVIIVPLLNAYNSEVYYGGYNQDLSVVINKGYKNINILLEEIYENFYDCKFIFTGNGYLLYKDLINKKFNNKIIKNINLLKTCSTKKIGEMGFRFWSENNNISSELFPLYLKSQTFTVK